MKIITVMLYHISYMLYMLYHSHVIFKADMLVNSAAVDCGELKDCGPISVAFCKAGGDAIANSFKQDGPLNIGETRTYVGAQGQLQCKVVAHIGIGRWKDRKSTQVHMQKENNTSNSDYVCHVH